MNIGIAITGSFCTYSQILKQIENLKNAGHNIVAIVSESVQKTNTRFGNAEEFLKKLKETTQNDVVCTIVEAEPLGPQNKIDVLAIAPCTGNTLSKLAHGLSDDAVTMSAKAHMRNFKPLVVAISTNDALGLNMTNLATLMNAKNVFFVPFGQDDPQKKPKSMIANLDLLEQTIVDAVAGKQIQPVVVGKN